MSDKKSKAKTSRGNSPGNTVAEAGAMAEVAVDTLGSQELPRRLIEESLGHSNFTSGWTGIEINQTLDRLTDPDLQTSIPQP